MVERAVLAHLATRLRLVALVPPQRAAEAVNRELLGALRV
jgi:hypothetical protein